MKVYFQWTTGEVELTPFCSPRLGCPYASHTDRVVYWAWDRQLGAWVHYAC